MVSAYPWPVSSIRAWYSLEVRSWTVAVINGLLSGVTVALAVATAGTPLPPTVLSGMASGTLILAVHVVYQVRRFARMKSTVAALFPSQKQRPALVRRPPAADRPVTHAAIG
jgi:hypothetical protein